MAASSGHYERALEAHLRRSRAPFVSVRAARRALLGESTRLTMLRRAGADGGAVGGVLDQNPDPGSTTGPRADVQPTASTLKSFDFVLYDRDAHLLLEVKGRRLPARSASARSSSAGRRAGPRLDSWVTSDDVESMRTWGRLFGTGYRPVFVFLYWCRDATDHAAFADRFEHDGRLYGVRAIDVADYAASMAVRSPRWRTVHVPTAAFEGLSRPLGVAGRFANAETGSAPGSEAGRATGLAAAEIAARPRATHPQPAGAR